MTASILHICGYVLLCCGFIVLATFSTVQVLNILGFLHNLSTSQANDAYIFALAIIIAAAALLRT